MVLKYVHNSMTILPQKVNSPPPEYRLTWVTHLLTNGMWPQWCQTTSKVRWEKAIQSPRGSLPFGTQDFRTLSQQHIRSLATQKPPFWRDHGKDYMEIERDVWTSPAVCPPSPGVRHVSDWHFRWFQLPRLLSHCIWAQVDTDELSLLSPAPTAGKWQNTCCCCFKPPSFGEVCYTALDNSNICSRLHLISDGFVFQCKISDFIVQIFPQHCRCCPLIIDISFHNILLQGRRKAKEIKAFRNLTGN